MEIKIRPIESLRAAVEEMQVQRRANLLAKGGRLLSAVGGTPPPNSSKNPSNLNDLVKLNKYFEMFKFDKTNTLADFKPNINKQSLTRFLKYLA